MVSKGTVSVLLVSVLLLVFVKMSSTTQPTIEEQWEKFKKDYYKNYGPEEDQRRFEIFKKKVEEVGGYNRFSDMTPEEVEQNSIDTTNMDLSFLPIPDHKLNPRREGETEEEWFKRLNNE